jgi:lipoic acid synthetase
MSRLPEWIREKRINLMELHEIKSQAEREKPHSVCESLACPNRTECFSAARDLAILGDICTRSCGSAT